jgi:hypothetical protein
MTFGYIRPKPLSGASPYLTLVGPASGTVGQAYTITLFWGNIVTGGAATLSWPGSETFSPSTISVTVGAGSQTFTITPSAAGAGGIVATLSALSSNSLTFTASDPAGVPIALGFDGANPENICLRCPISGTVAEGTTVQAQYKATASSTWIDGPFLNRVRLADLGTLPTDLVGKVTNSFVGTAFGVNTPSSTASTFDVRIKVTTPDTTVSYVTGTHTFQALAPTAPTVTHNCTPANFSTVFASLPSASGTDVHLRMAPGTYTVSNLVWNKSGTASKHLYVSAATRGDVIISAPSGTAISLDASYVVFEKIVFQGSGTDSGTSATSAGIVSSTTTRYQRITVRDCAFNGFDRAFKMFNPVDGFNIYNTTLNGNNTWALTYQDNGGQPNLTWNDDGFTLPGVGNSVWNCTISGHGDAFRVHTSSGIFFSAGTGMWRCDITRTGDDSFETDDSAGNVYAWRNRIKNAGNAISADGTYGPVYFVQNIVANTARGPIKVTSDSSNLNVISNSFVLSEKVSNHGILTPGGGVQRGLKMINNLFHYTGSGNALHWSAGLAEDTWANNAWYPDRGFLINGVGTYATLAAAKTGNAVRFANDQLLIAQPFDTAITLGASYTTEYLGVPNPVLSSGSAAKNAGLPVVGITTGFTGAAPDMGAIVSGQAGWSYGDVALPALPAWAPEPSTTPGNVAVRIMTVANGYLQNNAVDVHAPYYDTFFNSLIYCAYAGAVYNPYYVGPGSEYGGLFNSGGGHAATNNNTITVLMLGTSSLRFHRINDPTPFYGSSPANGYANETNEFIGLPYIDPATCVSPIDGQVVGTHTWGSLGIKPPSVDAPLGTLVLPWALVAGRNNDQGNYQSAFSYNVNKLSSIAATRSASTKWQFEYVSPGRPTGTTMLTLTPPPVWSVFDEPSQRRYLFTSRNAGDIYYFDESPGATGDKYVTASTGTKLDMGDISQSGNPRHLVHIPSKRVAIMIYNVAGSSPKRLAAKVFDLATGSWNNTRREFSLQIPVDGDWSCAAWSEKVQRLVIGDVQGAKNIMYTVEVPSGFTGTWAATQHTMDATCTQWRTTRSTGNDNANDYGAMAEVMGTGIMIYHQQNQIGTLLDQHTSEVFAFRLPGA